MFDSCIYRTLLRILLIILIFSTRTFAKEPPGPPLRDDKMNATNLLNPVNRGEFDVYGYLYYTGDLEWYCVDCGSGMIDITLSFSSYCDTCDFDLYLYDDYNNLIDYSAQWGNVDENIYTSITEGRYWIEVYSYYGAGGYDLFGTYPDPPSELPDLVIQSFSVDNNDPEIGDFVSVTIVVKNQGTGDAIGTFWVDLYYNLMSPPLPGDTGDVYWDIPGLDAGYSTTITTTVQDWSPGYWDSYV